MAMNRTNGSAILTPEQVGELLILPAMEASVAATASRVVHTSSADFRIPMVSADPTASWVAEGEEIDTSDATLNELVIRPGKLAGLTIITSELAADSTPEAAQTVGDGLARDIARKLDAAYFGTNDDPGNPGTPLAAQPAGLEDLSGVSTVEGAFTNLDPFIEALSAAEQVGARLGSFVTDPATALALATVKRATGSNEALLQPDPTQPTRRTIAGVPLLVSPAVTEGTVWGLPEGRAYVVVREDADVTTDGSVYFTSDRVAVRGRMRVGFGWPHAAAVVKITED